MNIGLIGRGGREQAIAISLTQSDPGNRLFVFGSSPNPGIRALAEILQIGSLGDVEAIRAFMTAQRVDLVMIGPEAPLMAGGVDALRGTGLPVVGPTRAQARLEGDKGYMRALLSTRLADSFPQWEVVDNPEQAGRFLQRVGEAAIKPLALSDGLNFGSPDDPAVAFQIREGLRGLSDACRELNIPIIGGNVSLFNETGGQPVLGQIFVCMVGIRKG